MADIDVTPDVTEGGANVQGAASTEPSGAASTEPTSTGATHGDNGAGQEKTYTQADFDKALQSETDRRVRQAMDKARSEWQKTLETEKEEAVRLAKLSADERAKAEFEKQQKEFAAERSKYNAERLEFETTKQLASEGLPLDFAKILCGADAEATTANIKSFKDAYSKAIEAAVNERLKAKPPETAPNQTEQTDPFLSGFNTI